MDKQAHFHPGQTYVRLLRQGREFGRVLEIIRGRVVMATSRDADRTQRGIETFNPAHDTGWRLCG